MKIKSILPFLCSLVLFSAASVMAQSNPGNFSTPPAADPAIHLGQTNPYEIGTPEDPVTAEDYCAFLNKEYSRLNFEQIIAMYDPAIMTGLSKDIFGRLCYSHGPTPSTKNNKACIQVVQVSSVPEQYSFKLISGRGNEIIDAVQLQTTQTAFNQWRLNPTVSELCDYMNAQIAGDTDGANVIKNKYSAAALPLFDKAALYANNYIIFTKANPSWYSHWIISPPYTVSGSGLYASSYLHPYANIVKQLRDDKLQPPAFFQKTGVSEAYRGVIFDEIASSTCLHDEAGSPIIRSSISWDYTIGDATPYLPAGNDLSSFRPSDIGFSNPEELDANTLNKENYGGRVPSTDQFRNQYYRLYIQEGLY